MSGADLKTMYAPGTRPRPGAHCSDGMHVDSTWHFHDMHQLLYAFEGAIEVESVRGRHLVPRQLAAWIPAGVPHRTSIHRVRSGSVFFTTDMLTDSERRVRTVVVSTLMREMMREAMRWPLHHAECPTGAAFFQAMAKLCGEWIAHEVNLLLPTSVDPRLRRALNYTAQHMDSELTEVCRHAGMSERSMRRHLKNDIGMTWEAFRRHSRLLHAVSLLSETDTAVGTIAAQCGFESPSAFAKAFRLAVGETPRNYRSRFKDTLQFANASATPDPAPTSGRR
jgi:AraC-like DNA-binding protein